ncbi:MAG: Vitamin B12 dependent methionine synthase activation subunit [Ruminococcaceae bacterium]|nr:Vitamin B12 dependent methionine synthase activation subunit [Oscillospiraceae bacterium]
MNTVFTKIFNPPSFNKGEILRYAGVKELTAEIDTLIDECIEEAKDKLTYKVCYGHFPLSFIQAKSEKLEKNLSGCNSIVLFAATVGIELDRLISRYGKISPAKALIFQAIGTERIESLCDEFCRFAETEYGHTKPRFSPGYGDLPLEVQKDFFRVLDPSKRIGLTLNESMLMTPSKSVTAIIGITDEEITEKKSCKTCNKTDCLFRRTL